MADEGQYRVLPALETGYRWLDRETYEPVVLAAEGHDAPVADLRPGYLVDATPDWSTSEPTVSSLSVVRPTLYAFADEVEPVFEAARETWERARADGEPMATQVLRNTDNEVIGVVYVFAESGDRGRFEEFRDGSRPLEPLVDRVNERREPAPREVFVLRGRDGEFTAVAIAFNAGARFADTMRDTYDLRRPTEPLG
jgi:hypothetical protein